MVTFHYLYITLDKCIIYIIHYNVQVVKHLLRVKMKSSIGLGSKYRIACLRIPVCSYHSLSCNYNETDVGVTI